MFVPGIGRKTGAVCSHAAYDYERWEQYGMAQEFLAPVEAGNDAVARGNEGAPSRALGTNAALGRIWLAVNLLALSAVGIACMADSPLHLLAGWASFTLLNSILLWCGRSGVMVGNAAATNTIFNAAMAGIMGLAWGGGVALLTPFSSGDTYGVLLAAAFAVALTAVPVFGGFRHAFMYFITTFAVVSVGGILKAGHYPYSVLWIAFGCVSLLVVAGVYYTNLDALRASLREVLGRIPGDGEEAGNPDDDLLARTAIARVDSLHGAHRDAAYRDHVLGALADAIVATDSRGNIEYANPLAEVMCGKTAAELVGKPVDAGLRILLPPDKRNHAREVFDQVRLTRRPQHGTDTAQLVRRDGVVYGIDLRVSPMRDEYGEFAGCVFMLRDVTQRRHRDESMAWQATHDALTGAINRAEFELRLKKLVKRAQDGDNVHTLLFLDLDRFKRINDNYGHAAGDAGLKALSALLRQRIRGADTLARIGGDEFAALLYSCPQDKARLIAEGLRNAVERHEFVWQGIHLPISLSIGIVEINQDCKSTPEILQAADSACFSAKKFGRNRVQLFERNGNDSMHHARVFDFVKDIQTAIQGNRMELFYEPLHTARTRASEMPTCILSVGMRDKSGDLMPRREVLELAARYQLIEEIDRWVVKAAIDALRLHHPTLDEMDLVIVSLSQSSMADERLLDDIVAMINEYPETGSRLGFSFDESGIAGQLEQVRFFMSRLRQLGCRFMINDLGFGNESLALLKSLKADFLGIGAPLVQGMLANSVDYEVVLGLSRVAHALGMQTIADKADSPSLVDALAQMGVDYTRGNLGEQPRPITISSDAQWI